MGAEAQRLLDVSLGILSLAEMKLGGAYFCVRASQISIQLQRPLALPDALRDAVSTVLNYAQAQMGDCTLGSERQRLGHSRFSGSEPRGSIVRKERCRDNCIYDGNADQSPYVVGVQSQGLLEQAASLSEGGVKVTEARRRAARRPSRSGDLCREGAPLGQGSRASLLVDLPRDEMALLIELVVHLGVN